MVNNAKAQFAQWLGEVHPEMYEALFAHAIASGVNSRTKTQLRGFGDVGDDFGLSDFTPALQDIQVDTGNLDYVVGSSMSDIADALPLFDLSSTSQSTGTLTASSSVSSGGGLMGAIGSVGDWLTSKQGLTSIANLGTAVLNTVASTQVAKAQMAVVQAQAARAQQNKSPLPITYTTNQQGQLIPVYDVGASSDMIPPALQQAIGSGAAQLIGLPNGSTGYTIPQNTLNSMLGGNTGILLLLGGAALVLTLMAEHSA